MLTNIRPTSPIEDIDWVRFRKKISINKYTDRCNFCWETTKVFVFNLQDDWGITFNICQDCLDNCDNSKL